SEAGLRMVDVGTGSGCIALALASEFPCASIFATDLSRPALAVAVRNARQLGLSTRVEFVQGDLLECFAAGDGGAFDFVASNPPYVSRDEIRALQREVRDFEPGLALGGLSSNDGIYRRLIPQAHALLKEGGHVILEVGYSMAEKIAALLGEGWSGVEIRPDLGGIPRVVMARKQALRGRA
ncbi:MAG: N5-glutamine methyltransferase family protein, partial [Terriglobia bacterium]